MNRRHGMILVESSSGEYDTLAKLQELAATDSESEEGDDATEYGLMVVSSPSSGDDGSYHSDNDELAEYWDPYLYQLQLKAPKPHAIPCMTEVHDRPSYYGDEYHGCISREETSKLLGSTDGNYLVRSGLSQAGSYSLSFVFGGQVRHYRLYYDPQEKCHLVGEKPLDTIEELVQDGLITLYMEANNVEDYLQSARRRTRRFTTSSSSSYASIPSISLLRPHPQASAQPEPLMEETEDDTLSPSLPSPPPIIPREQHPPREERERSSSTSSDHSHTYRRSRCPRAYDEVEDVTLTASQRLKHKQNSLYFYYDKPHSFKLHNYIGLAWCDFCRNFMWGLRNQGYRCKDCGYNVHKQCRAETGQDCQPSRLLVKRVFCVELTTLVKMHGTKVPVVISSCIEEVEKRGLSLEGLYRVSGQTSEVLRIKKEFDRDASADLQSCEDTHAITGALKLYLRELPVPLVTFDAYDMALIAAGCRRQEERIETMKKALARLPLAHYNTLRHLLRHLYKVQMMKTANRMDAKNLSIVFAPTLMRSPDNTGDLSVVHKLPQQRKAVELLITYCHMLFQY